MKNRKLCGTHPIAWLFVAGVCFGATSLLQAETLIFGGSWSLPDAVAYQVNPTPIALFNSQPPDPSNPDPPPPDVSGFEKVRITQFRPEWGTLDAVILEVDGSALFTAQMSGPVIPSGTLGFSTFSIEGFISGPGYSGAGSDLKEVVDEIKFLSFVFGFDGPVASGPFMGTGLVDYDVNYAGVIGFAVDENRDGFFTPDDADLWETRLIGGYLGTVVVTYVYTPTGLPAGGPPGGQGGCPNCGPLPGDYDLDGFVGIGDMNIVLGNWNVNIAGWNNGDSDGDGFVGITDLNVVLGNWNAGTPPLIAATIPEPSAILLFCGGLSGMTLRMSRKADFCTPSRNYA